MKTRKLERENQRQTVGVGWWGAVGETVSQRQGRFLGTFKERVKRGVTSVSLTAQCKTDGFSLGHAAFLLGEER